MSAPIFLEFLCRDHDSHNSWDVKNTRKFKLNIILMGVNTNKCIFNCSIHSKK